MEIKKSIKHLFSQGLRVREVFSRLFFIKDGKEFKYLSRIDSNYVSYFSKSEGEKPVILVVGSSEVEDFFDDILVDASLMSHGDLTPIYEVDGIFIDQLYMYADDWNFVHAFDEKYYFSLTDEYDLKEIPSFVTHVEEIGK
jgi:hypothetical protein